MRRGLLSFVFLVVVIALAHASIPLRGGSSVCPTSSPSPDGSIITPVGIGSFSCTLIDFQANTWRFSASTLQSNGVDVSSGYSKFEIAGSGHAYAQFTCAGPGLLWTENGGNGFNNPVPSPGVANDQAPFADTTQALTFTSFFGMITSGSVLAGDTLEVKALNGSGSPPIWQGAGRIQLNNITVTIDSGAKIGCSSDLSRAIFPVNGSISGFKVQGSGASVSFIGYAHDTQFGGGIRCIDEQNGSGWTISGVLIQDCDMGMIGNTTLSGTDAITDVEFDHNGGNGAGSSATHNVYLGAFLAGNLSTITVSGGGSYCTNGVDVGPGFEFKTRFVGGAFSNWTAAEPSQHGFSDCAESADVDLSCGGNYTIGGATAGQGAVLELSNGIKTNGSEFVRYGRDDSTGNCGAGSTPWSDANCNTAFGQNCALLIQNCWVINDTSPAVALSVVTIDATIPAGRVTVKNCKLVGNVSLGTGVTDGGGNTTFADRTAAGLSAYPALPNPP